LVRICIFGSSTGVVHSFVEVPNESFEIHKKVQILCFSIAMLSGHILEKSSFAIYEESIQAVEYRIDGETVSMKKFKRVYSRLRPMPNTWYCAETSDGLVQGCQMINLRNRKVYGYRFFSTANGQVEQLRLLS
jgi:hypothetical protein